MRIPGDLRLLLLGLAYATGILAQVDGREIIRQAVAADERNWKIARNYTFVQRVELRRLDSRGRVKSSETKTHDVSLLDGTPYRQLIERNDRVLPPNEEKKERESLARTISQRRRETAAARAERLSEYERRPDWLREAWHDLPDAFDFRLAGEQMLDGRATLIFEAMPRKGFQPRSHTGKVLPSLKGRFWVNQQDQRIIKVEMEVLDTISIGLVLVRVAKGSRAILELANVGEGILVPGRLQVFASARIGLLKALYIEQETHYSQYRNVPTDARTIDPAERRDPGTWQIRSARAISP